MRRSTGCSNLTALKAVAWHAHRRAHTGSAQLLRCSMVTRRSGWQARVRISCARIGKLPNRALDRLQPCNLMFEAIRPIRWPFAYASDDAWSTLMPGKTKFAATSLLVEEILLASREDPWQQQLRSRLTGTALQPCEHVEQTAQILADSTRPIAPSDTARLTRFATEYCGRPCYRHKPQRWAPPCRRGAAHPRCGAAAVPDHGKGAGLSLSNPPACAHSSPKDWRVPMRPSIALPKRVASRQRIWNDGLEADANGCSVDGPDPVGTMRRSPNSSLHLEIDAWRRSHGASSRLPQPWDRP